jgi:hypothetical protein
VGVTVTAPNKSGARKAVGGNVVSITEVITVSSIRAMSPKVRSKFFRQVTDEQVEALTVPCTGEAHSNAYIDNCSVCMGVLWGRMLKPAGDK